MRWQHIFTLIIEDYILKESETTMMYVPDSFMYIF